MTGLTVPAVGSGVPSVKGGAGSTLAVSAPSGVPSLASFVDIMASGAATATAGTAPTRGPMPASERQVDAAPGKSLPHGDDDGRDPALRWLFAAMPVAPPTDTPAPAIDGPASAITDATEGKLAIAPDLVAADPDTVDGFQTPVVAKPDSAAEASVTVALPAGLADADPALALPSDGADPAQAQRALYAGAIRQPETSSEIPALKIPAAPGGAKAGPAGVERPPAGVSDDLPDAARPAASGSSAPVATTPRPAAGPAIPPLATMPQIASASQAVQPAATPAAPDPARTMAMAQPAGQAPATSAQSVAVSAPTIAAPTTPPVIATADGPVASTTQAPKTAMQVVAAPVETRAHSAGALPVPPLAAPGRPPTAAASAAGPAQAAAMPALFALNPAARDTRENRDTGLSVTGATGVATLLQSAGTTMPVAGAGDAQQQALDMGRHDWPQKMIDRIDVLRDAANANDTSIRLVPDALGRVDVAIRHQGDGAVSVHFTAEHAATRAMIADARPQLTAAAEARGIRLSGTSVDLTGSGQGQGGDQARQQFELRQNISNRLAAREDETMAVDDGRIA